MKPKVLGLCSVLDNIVSQARPHPPPVDHFQYQKVHNIWSGDELVFGHLQYVNMQGGPRYLVMSNVR